MKRSFYLSLNILYTYCSFYNNQPNASQNPKQNNKRSNVLGPWLLIQTFWKYSTPPSWKKCLQWEGASFSCNVMFRCRFSSFGMHSFPTNPQKFFGCISFGKKEWERKIFYKIRLTEHLIFTIPSINLVIMRISRSLSLYPDVMSVCLTWVMYEMALSEKNLCKVLLSVSYCLSTVTASFAKRYHLFCLSHNNIQRYC